MPWVKDPKALEEDPGLGYSLVANYRLGGACSPRQIVMVTFHLTLGVCVWDL